MQRLLCGMMICATAAMISVPAQAENGMVTVPRIGTVTNVPIETAGIGVSKVVGIEAVNVLSNKTIIISSVINGVTYALSTSTTTTTDGGRQFFDFSSSGWFYWARGDTLLRSGTDTNSILRIIYSK
jgi:hypothetical protein